MVHHRRAHCVIESRIQSERIVDGPIECVTVRSEGSRRLDPREWVIDES